MKPIEEIEEAIMAGVKLAKEDGKKIVPDIFITSDKKCMCPLTAWFFYVHKNANEGTYKASGTDWISPCVLSSFKMKFDGDGSRFIVGFDGDFSKDELTLLGLRLRNKLLDVST